MMSINILFEKLLPSIFFQLIIKAMQDSNIVLLLFPKLQYNTLWKESKKQWKEPSIYPIQVW